MSEFKIPNPGEPADIVFSARYHQALIRNLEASQQFNGSSSIVNGSPVFSATPLVKNTAGVEVPRGGVLQLDDIIFDAEDNEGAFLTGEPQFKGIAPTGGKSSTLAIALGPMPADSIRRMGVVGWYPALVDIKDIEHRSAKAIDDTVDNLESGSGLPMIPAESGAGVKKALVLLGAASAQASVTGGYCLLLADIPPAQLADSNGNMTSGKADAAVKMVRVTDSFDVEPDPDNPDPLQGINFTLQTIKFHANENIILPCDLVELNEAKAAVFKHRDTRARIGWDLNTEQADFHEAGSRDTKLGHGECQP